MNAERPTVPSFQSETRLRRLPFLESSLRVLPAHSSDSEATGLGRQNADPDGPPAGVAVPPAGRCRSRSLGRELRTGTDCSGSGLAISLHIVYRYKLLNRGCTLACKKHRGSPPLAGLAPNQHALITIWETGPADEDSAAGLSTQDRSVTHQLLGTSYRHAFAGVPTIASRARPI
jgi:hypothetical protein